MKTMKDLIWFCIKHPDFTLDWSGEWGYENFCGLSKTDLSNQLYFIIRETYISPVLYDIAYRVFSPYIIYANNWRETNGTRWTFGGKQPRKFPDELKIIKYFQQKGICPSCNRHFCYQKMDGDHIYPWSKGGITAWSNLQMLCKDCNNNKSDTII